MDFHRFGRRDVTGDVAGPQEAVEWTLKHSTQMAKDLCRARARYFFEKDTLSTLSYSIVLSHLYQFNLYLSISRCASSVGI